ncbi:UNVERIFIED_CONTAM: hypothetical protein Sangu_0384400 [Sesamum angustifolium]|uniref:Uncharacterized protein n=1 Tax=Sesamum angustifolium TaxID=2727405 RepID=A0AAW2QS46_9LAMI
MGDGHSGTIPIYDWAKEIPPSYHRLLHKMDRGRTSGPYHLRGSYEVHMEKHHMSLRIAPRNNIRQWLTIPRMKDTRLVCRATYKAKVHLGISSLGQRSS